MKSTHVLVKSLSFLILIVAVPILGFYLNKAPRLAKGDVPLKEFSAVRAMNHLEHIASKPHSLGTKEHAKVRDYIVDEIKKMGVEPEIQDAEVFYPGKATAAKLKNIIVTLPGTEPGKSVLIAGHYDSVRDSYGASDDGSAVVTMLETIRLLQLSNPFKNDIVFLFTDGEEMGLLGAQAFVEQHPLAKNTGLVLNFESSGTTGPSLMFETSTDNNWLITEFAKAVPSPVANSLSYEIYRNMPNDTDLTPFKKNGYKGFNFAYIENRFDYHTAGDNIKNTSIESIQHHGNYAVSLIRHFANIDLNNSEKGNAVYFNTIGKGFVHYSDNWMVPLLILTCLLLVGTLLIGFRRKLIRPIGLLLGFLAFIVHMVIVPSIITLIYFILLKYYPGNDYRLLYYNQNTLLLGFAALAISVSFLFYNLAMKGIRWWHLMPFIALLSLLLIWSGLVSLLTILATVGLAVIIYFLFRKPIIVWELSVGSFLGWAILMVIVSLRLPGASYMFTWPLLFSLIPVTNYFLSKNHSEYSVLQLGLFLLCALPALLWLSNLTYLFLVAMGLEMAGGAILFTVLCLSLLIVPIEIITRVKPLFVPLVSFAAALFFLFYGSVNLQYNERYKKQNSLVLATNGNTNKTFLTSFNYKTDEWTVDYLTAQPDTTKLDDFIQFENRDFLVKAIEGENLPTPVLTIMNDTTIGKERLVKLHLNSGRKADKLYIQIKAISDTLKATINKSEMKVLQLRNRTGWYHLMYYALPDEGIDMELKWTGNQNLEICLSDFIYGLPDLKDIKINPRGENMMPDGDMTMATMKFMIPALPVNEIALK